MTITNITLAQLHILTAIVDEASFSAAAIRIGMTQSGASQAMRALEAVLGVKLLVRDKGGVVPTEIGRAVLQDARDAALAIERIRQRCAAASGLQIGELRIGSVASAAARLLPRILAQFRRLYPEVKLTLLEGMDREVLEWVQVGIVDVGLTSEASPDTEGHVVVSDDFLLVVNHEHPFSKRRRIKLQDVARENFLMSGSGCEPAIRRLFALAGVTPIITLTVRDTAALAEMVSQGLGVTVMPELSIPENQRRLCRIPIDPRSRRQVLAVTHRKTPPLPVVEKFVQLLTGRAGRGDRPGTGLTGSVPRAEEPRRFKSRIVRRRML